MYRKIISALTIAVMCICIVPFTGIGISYAAASPNYDEYYIDEYSDILEVGDLATYGGIISVTNMGDTPIKLKQTIYLDPSDTEPFKPDENYYGNPLEIIVKKSDGTEFTTLDPAMISTVREIKKYAEGDYFVIEYIMDKFVGDWFDNDNIKIGDIINDAEKVPDINNIREEGDIKFNIEIDGKVVKTYKVRAKDSTGSIDGYYDEVYDIMYGKSYELANVEYIEDTATLTYSFINAEYKLTKEHLQEFEAFKDKLQDVLAPCNGTTFEIKIADPKAIDIGDWEEWAVTTAFDIDPIALKYGLDSMMSPNEDSHCFFTPYYYKDKAMKQRIEDISNLKPEETIYINFVYEGQYKWRDLGIAKSFKVGLDTPVKAKYSIVDVDKESDEVKKIRSVNHSVRYDVTYDDLAWINILNYVGFDPKMPNAGHADSMLRNLNPEVYDKLVGDTKLDIKVPFGRSGTSTDFSKEVVGRALYYVDDVFYYAGSEIRIGMVNSVYVPKNSKDRVKAAEERIKAYMDDADFPVRISGFDNVELAKFVLKNFNRDEYRIIGDIRGDVYAYLTEYGVALYNTPNKTSKEYFVAFCPFVECDVFDNGTIEKAGTVDYIHMGQDGSKKNVPAYKAYKLNLDGQEYVYTIGEKSKDQLKNPLADWEDIDSGIITEGENGQVVTDFYTKIRKVGKDEIKVISKKVNGKNVKAFDINAFTNFKEEGITDLGNGVVKVMIPLEDFGEENLQAFYYDQKGNVIYLDYVIEEDDGIKYVCFTTNHFSTYGIASDDNSAVSETIDNDYSEVDTGDSFNVTIPIAIGLAAIVAMIAVVAFRRRTF